MKTVWRIFTDPTRDIKCVERFNVQDWQFKDVVKDLRSKASRQNHSASLSGDPGHVRITTRKPR